MALIDRLKAAFAAFREPDVETTETPAGTRPGDLFGSVGDHYYRRMHLEAGRLARYNDYDKMDRESGEIQAVLDLVADESVQADKEPFDALTVESDDQRLKDFLNGLLDRVGLREDTWSLARDLAKFGDEFNEVVVNRDNDVVRFKPLDRRSMFREQDEYGRTPEVAFTQRRDQTSTPIATFSDWQVVHFRNRRSRKDLYGTSWVEPARKIYLQLSLVEDGIVITRLSRANMRYAVMVDTGTMTPDDAMAFIENKVKPQFKKRRMIDPSTGQLALRDSPLTADEDLFLPLREGSKSDVKVLQGDVNLGRLMDVEYFRNKLYAAMKVPKAFLGLEADTAGKNVIQEIEVSWARSCRREQVTIQAGVRQLCRTALIVRGVQPDQIPFKVLLPPISTIDELREWQVEQIKAGIANIWGSQMNVVSTRFILKKYLGLTDEEITKMALEEKPEKKSFSFGHEELPNAPPVEEVRRVLSLANSLDTLRLLVDAELEAKAYGRARDPVRKGRTISLPASIHRRRLWVDGGDNGEPD